MYCLVAITVSFNGQLDVLLRHSVILLNVDKCLHIILQKYLSLDGILLNTLIIYNSEHNCAKAIVYLKRKLRYF